MTETVLARSTMRVALFAHVRAAAAGDASRSSREGARRSSAPTRELGLALAPDEIDYLDASFRRSAAIRPTSS